MAIEERWLEPYLPAGGGVAVDVGANHGTWSAWLAARFAKVYAVEPNPALLPALNAIAPNVEVIPVGAWDRAQWHDFAIYEQDVHLSAKFYNGGINTRQPLGTVHLWCQPLDEMPIEGRVEFVKVDTEAAEVEVLRGAQRMIQHDRPRMIVEVHTEANGVWVETAMQGWGYRVRVVRHPYYAPVAPLWAMHYWMVCEPA